MKAHARDKSTFTVGNLVVDISVNWSLGFPHGGEPLLHNPLPESVGRRRNMVRCSPLIRLYSMEKLALGAISS